MNDNNPDLTQQTNNPDNQQFPPNPITIQAAAVFSAGWLPAVFNGPTTTESPPEDLLAVSLSTLLWRELESGRLELTRRAVVRHPILSAEFYELDLLLAQPASGARGVIEVSAWQHHGAKEERYVHDLRRVRELERIGLRVLTYSAREVARNPWAVALEAHTHIQTVWSFEPYKVPAAVLDAARRSAVELDASPFQVEANGDSAAANAISWTEVREAIGRLPSLAAPRDAREARIRSRWQRAYEPWTKAELTWLRQAQTDRLGMAHMVELFQRPPGALRRRIERL